MALQPYSVTVYDCAGEFVGRRVADFAAAVVAYRELRAKFPRLYVQVVNDDQCDYNHDGLTEDERDAIETVDAVRAAEKAVAP